jgi:hypothetical protein
MKLYMFRTVSLSIIRTLFTVHSARVYVIEVCRQLSSRTWHIPLLSVQWIKSWWWTDELSETCRVACHNKFVKLVHLVGFIIKKFVTMRGHANVKTNSQSYNFVRFNIYFGGQDDAVVIATCYGLEGPGIELRWGRDYPRPSRPATGPTTCTVVTGALSRG